MNWEGIEWYWDVLWVVVKKVESGKNKNWVSEIGKWCLGWWVNKMECCSWSIIRNCWWGDYVFIGKICLNEL